MMKRRIKIGLVAQIKRKFGRVYVFWRGFHFSELLDMNIFSVDVFRLFLEFMMNQGIFLFHTPSTCFM